MAAERRILVGVVGAPHGVRGEVRVKSFTADPPALGAYQPLTDAAGARVFVAETLRRIKDDMLVVKFAGVDERNAAQAITGVQLFAPRAALPEPSEDEFYHADLIGLSAVTRGGEALGEVVALRNFGAGDILEILPAPGQPTLLLPFTKSSAPEIDFPNHRIVIEPPIVIPEDSAEV